MKQPILLILLCLSLQINAQNQAVVPNKASHPTIVKPEDHGNFSSINYTDPITYSYTDSITYGSKYATWYLKLNLKELRKSNLLKLFKDRHIVFSKNSSMQLNDVLPENIEKIWLYGNSFKRSGDVTMVLQGSFSDVAILELIEKELYTVNGVSQLGKLKSIHTRGNEIYVFKLSNTGGRHKKKYAARLKDGLFILSSNLREVRQKVLQREGEGNWLKKKNKVDYVEDNDLLVLSLNTEIALENANLNISRDDYVMQSQLFKKAKNIVATIHLNQGKLMINSALTTKSTEIAIQIKNILSGISAMNILTDENNSDTLESVLVNNLVIKRKDKNVHLETFVLVNKLNKSK